MSCEWPMAFSVKCDNVNSFLLDICTQNSVMFYGITTQWRTQGGWGVQPPPPPTGKMLFPKALFLATKFHKNISKFNFPIEFSSKNFKIFSEFPQRPNARKFNPGPGA